MTREEAIKRLTPFLECSSCESITDINDEVCSECGEILDFEEVKKDVIELIKIKINKETLWLLKLLYLVYLDCFR